MKKSEEFKIKRYIAEKVSLHPEYRPIPARPKATGQPKHHVDAVALWEDKTAMDRAMNGKLYLRLKDELLAELVFDD